MPWHRALRPQPLDNYTYYDNGHLKSDSADFIRKIHWNVANKIDRIEFATGSGKPEEIAFRYDAMGERVVKIVKPTVATSSTWTWTYYVRDAQGNVMATYERKTFDANGTTIPPGYQGTQQEWDATSEVKSIQLSEQHLYGSSRLGILGSGRYLAVDAPVSGQFFGTVTDLPAWYDPFLPPPGDPCGCGPCASPPCDPCWCVDIDPGCSGPPCGTQQPGGQTTGCPIAYCYGDGWPALPIEEADHILGSYTRGKKRYELSNHLGNVLAVISDRKLQIDDGNGTVVSYNPDIWAYNDYYPFGMTMMERTWQAGDYRYGFGGHEKVNEVFGNGNVVDMGDRWLDVRLGRTTKPDRKASKYPGISPFAFAGGNPILFTDPNGEDLFIAGKTEVALEDLKSLVPEKYRSLIKMSDDNENEIVFEGYENLSDEVKQYEGVKLLNDLISSEKNYQYTVGDIGLGRERIGYDGTNQGEAGETYRLSTETDRNETEFRFTITNLSTTPNSAVEGGDYMPEEGFDGTLRISDGTYYRINSMTGGGSFEYPRNNVVFHELLENYLRTDENKDYPTVGRVIGAHEEAGSHGNKFSRQVNGKRDSHAGQANEFKAKEEE